MRELARKIAERRKDEWREQSLTLVEALFEAL